MLFWGISFVWTKQLLNVGFPVFTIICLRLILASVIFVSLFALQHKLEKIQKGDWRYFLLLAFFEPFLYFIGEEYGLQHVSASFASVIISLIPIVVSFTMYFVEGVKITKHLMVGILVSVLGIVLMTFGPDSSVDVSVRGLLWLLLALASAGGYSVLLVRLVHKYSPITVTTYQNLLAIPLYLPFVSIFDLKQWDTIVWTGSAWLNLLCLAVLCSAGSYMLYSYAVQKIAITKLSVCTNAIPIITILFASLMGLESFTIQKFIGILVVVLGVIVSQMKDRPAVAGG